MSLVMSTHLNMTDKDDGTKSCAYMVEAVKYRDVLTS